MWTVFLAFIEFLLQCCFCSMFCFFPGPEACELLAPWPGIEHAPPALQGEVLTTEPPVKSLTQSSTCCFPNLFLTPGHAVQDSILCVEQERSGCPWQCPHSWETGEGHTPTRSLPPHSHQPPRRNKHASQEGFSWHWAVPLWGKGDARHVKLVLPLSPMHPHLNFFVPTVWCTNLHFSTTNVASTKALSSMGDCLRHCSPRASKPQMRCQFTGYCRLTVRTMICMLLT